MQFQILCQDNSIIEVHLCVEYNIDDPILVSNSLNDITISLKSLARSTLVSFVSKINGMKIEQQIYTIETSLKVKHKRACKIKSIFTFLNRMNSIILFANGALK